MSEELYDLSSGEMFWDWLESRNYWLLLLAIPALLGSVGVAAFAFYQLTWTSTRAEVNCLEVSRNAYTAGDYPRSKLAQQALLDLASRAEPEYLYKLAQSYSKLGRRTETVAILGGLAPLDKPGHPPAHLFLAQALMLPTDVSPQALRLAETHLLRLLALQPQNTDARQLLGQLYVRLGQWEDARKQLSAVVSERPEAALYLALTQRGLGDVSASRTWADRAAKHFASKVSKSATNDAALRANWADALVLLDDYRAAADALETGWKRYRDEPCRAALARVCFAWAADLAKDPASRPLDRFQVIQRGLEAAPENPELLRELALLGSEPGEVGDAARAKAGALLSDGRHAALLHLSLGGVAWQRGELEQARTHYEAALRSRPAPAEAANNLAAILATGPKPDLVRALQLVRPLLEHQPDNPFFRDTRGQILLRQGRAEEALLDLEFALPQLADPRPTHTALAKAYAQLGLKELAAEHQRRAAATNAVPAGR
jgi:tetratricopeptide (TPR) repeat protein